MPTYQYRCSSCKHEFEEFQSMSDDPLVRCPSCKKRKLVRVISGAGLVFKGSGFYLTDYKNRGSAPAGGGARKDSVSGEGSGGTDSSSPSGAKKEGAPDTPKPGGGGKKEHAKRTGKGDSSSGGTA